MGVPGHSCPQDHIPNDLKVPLELQTWTNITWEHFTARIKWNLRLWFTLSPLFHEGQTLEISEDSRSSEESVDVVGGDSEVIGGRKSELVIDGDISLLDVWAELEDAFACVVGSTFPGAKR